MILRDRSCFRRAKEKIGDAGRKKTGKETSHCPGRTLRHRQRQRPLDHLRLVEDLEKSEKKMLRRCDVMGIPGW